jgi:hypothetical protein
VSHLCLRGVRFVGVYIVESGQSVGMAGSARDPLRVLELMRVLYELGAVENLEPGALVAELDNHDLRGFNPEEEPFYLMIGEILGLLLEHSTTEPEAAFAATRADLLVRRNREGSGGAGSRLPGRC